MTPPLRRYRPTALAAVAAFVAALGAAYAVSSTGNAAKPAPPVGARAEALDVGAPSTGTPSIGGAADVPALARRKQPAAPPPAPVPVETTTTTETAPPSDTTTESTPPPPTPAPVTPAPAPVAPTPTPAPAPPAVEFDDSG